jgi:hypothetical protein
MLTDKENILLRRALDPASSPAEAAKAAEAFVNSLRKRGLNGYDFMAPPRRATNDLNKSRRLSRNLSESHHLRHRALNLSLKPTVA